MIAVCMGPKQKKSSNKNTSDVENEESRHPRGNKKQIAISFSLRCTSPYENHSASLDDMMSFRTQYSVIRAIMFISNITLRV